MAVNINVPSQVKTYANLAAFPASGALKTIYIAEDTNKTYRWTGSVYVEVSASASGITIGTTAITSGTVGRVLFEGTGNVVQESANLFWDNTNGRLGIGTSSPSNSLTIKTGVNDDGILLESSVGNPLFLVRKDGTSNSTAELFQYANGSIRLAIRSASNFSYFNGGNFGFGTTTDAGFRLDVNGTARVKGTGTTSSTTAFTVQNSAGTNMLQLRDDNYQLFGGWLAMESSRYIYKANNATGILTLCNDSTVASFVNLYGSSHATLPNVIDFGTASTSRMIISPTGNVGIGTTSPSTLLHVAGNITIGGASATTVSSTYNSTTRNQIRYTNGASFEFHEGVSERVRLAPASGNVLINTTTDAGYKLDVNGTARVSGLLTVDNLTGNSVRASFFNTINNAITVFQSFTASGNAAFYNSVSIGTTSTPVASAQLEVLSTTKGFLPPRMTTTQKNAIASPAAGLQVYDTTLNRPCFYDGTTWITL